MAEARLRWDRQLVLLADDWRLVGLAVLHFFGGLARGRQLLDNRVRVMLLHFSGNFLEQLVGFLRLLQFLLRLLNGFMHDLLQLFGCIFKLIGRLHL